MIQQQPRHCPAWMWVGVTAATVILSTAALPWGLTFTAYVEQPWHDQLVWTMDMATQDLPEMPDEAYQEVFEVKGDEFFTGLSIGNPILLGPMLWRVWACAAAAAFCAVLLRGRLRALAYVLLAGVAMVDILTSLDALGMFAADAAAAWPMPLQDYLEWPAIAFVCLLALQGFWARLARPWGRLGSVRWIRLASALALTGLAVYLGYQWVDWAFAIDLSFNSLGGDEDLQQKWALARWATLAIPLGAVVGGIGSCLAALRVPMSRSLAVGGFLVAAVCFLAGRLVYNALAISVMFPESGVKDFSPTLINFSGQIVLTMLVVLTLLGIEGLAGLLGPRQPRASGPGA
ncbi:MAG: hypothetical protein ACLFUJ_06360 [Phycisphaerae bacterium]